MCYCVYISRRQYMQSVFVIIEADISVYIPKTTLYDHVCNKYVSKMYVRMRTSHFWLH